MAAVGLPAAPLAARLAHAMPFPPGMRDTVIPPPPARAAIPIPPPDETTAAGAAPPVHAPGNAPPPPPPPPPPEDVPPNSPPQAADAGDAPGAAFTIQTVPNPTAATTATVDTVVVTPTPTGPPGGEGPPPPPSQQQGEAAQPQDEDGGASPQYATTGECRLMGPFAIFVQLGLGALALMSLVYKRWRERPQRPVKIWFFDASKQVFGSVLVHVANVFMSLLTSGRFSVMATPGVVTARRSLGGLAVRALTGRDEEDYMPNPCSFYLLNLAIDTTLGIPILIFLLHLATALVAHTPLGQPPASIQSGNYGHPPRVWWWLKQSVLYFCGLFGMKMCVLVIFLTMPWIVRVGDWALGWTEGNEQLQIVFVMMLFPLIMNAMQYYIIDSFIKEQGTTVGGGDDHDDACDHGHRRHHRYDHLGDSADDEDDDSENDSSENDHQGGAHRRHHHAAHGDHSHSDASSLLADDEDEDEEELEELEELDQEATVPKKKKNTPPTSPVATHHNARPEYDPALDGDSPTIIGSSSSQRSRHASVMGSLSKEMYSKE